MPAYTDDPATTATHVRTVHINELRRYVDFFRAQAGLGPIAWIDGMITNRTYIRASHFTQLASAIQDLWTAHGMGPLPGWSVGSAPSPTRYFSQRDINDLRTWLSASDPPLNVWTGFHWCNPLSNLPPSNQIPLSPNEVAAGLLSTADRWGTVWLCPPSGGLDGGFSDALDQAAAAIGGLGNPKLDQCVVRIYNPSLPTFYDYDSAVTWIQPYLANLDYFINTYGGRNVVLFNELNITSEPQNGIDPRTIALIAAALRDHYSLNDQNRNLFLLFPGPGGSAVSNVTDWNGYWDLFDLRDIFSHAYQTFDQYYGSTVDARLVGHSMLYHGGNGIFDRVALHCYAADPTSFSLDDPVQNPALQTIQWYLNPPPGSGAAVVNTTGWCYVTECGGQCGTPGAPCFGDSADAGAALATFEALANARYTVSNAYANPPLLQAIYGYILDYSNVGATANGQYEIGNVSSGAPQLNSAYLNAYNLARSFP